MSNDDEDDKPTVVLDLEAIKAEMAQKKEAIEQDISFAAHENLADGNEESLNEDDNIDDLLADIESDDDLNLSQIDYLLFDYNSTFFEKNKDKLPGDFNYIVVSDLATLNSKMQREEKQVVIFNYNAAPKVVNQLTIQIKSKFPHVKTVIMAQKLSDEKAAQHQKTKSGAHAYISVPFKNENMIKILKNL